MKNKLKILLSVVLFLCACSSMSACNETPKKYNVIVNVWYSNYGFVDGGGTYEENMDCTITASAKGDSKFLAWMSENVIVSYEQTYTFKVSNETSGTYTAIFTCPNLELVSPTKIVFNDTYKQNNTISNILANVKIGGSYETLKEVLNTQINANKTFNIDSIKLALNRMTTIYAEINLTYTYETIIDNQSSNIDVKTQTYIEINLEDLLVTKEYKLNIPTNVNGEAYISFEFENFTIPQENNTEN